MTIANILSSHTVGFGFLKRNALYPVTIAYELKIPIVNKKAFSWFGNTEMTKADNAAYNIV